MKKEHQEFENMLVEDAPHIKKLAAQNPKEAWSVMRALYQAHDSQDCPQHTWLPLMPYYNARFTHAELGKTVPPSMLLVADLKTTIENQAKRNKDFTLLFEIRQPNFYKSHWQKGEGKAYFMTLLECAQGARQNGDDRSALAMLARCEDYFGAFFGEHPEMQRAIHAERKGMTHDRLQHDPLDLDAVVADMTWEKEFYLKQHNYYCLAQPDMAARVREIKAKAIELGDRNAWVEMAALEYYFARFDGDRDKMQAPLQQIDAVEQAAFEAKDYKACLTANLFLQKTFGNEDRRSRLGQIVTCAQSDGQFDVALTALDGIQSFERPKMHDSAILQYRPCEAVGLAVSLRDAMTTADVEAPMLIAVDEFIKRQRLMNEFETDKALARVDYVTDDRRYYNFRLTL